jgi:hypothetical protein
MSRLVGPIAKLLRPTITPSHLIRQMRPLVAHRGQNSLDRIASLEKAPKGRAGDPAGSIVNDALAPSEMIWKRLQSDLYPPM